MISGMEVATIDSRNSSVTTTNTTALQTKGNGLRKLKWARVPKDPKHLQRGLVMIFIKIWTN